jgi:cathepsin L
MTDMEFRSLLRAIPPNNNDYNSRKSKNIPFNRLNKYKFENGLRDKNGIDWRDMNIITPVKDQGMCGSCWAFSAAQGVESYFAMKYGKLVELSEQQILDCTPNPKHCGGTGGCGGGTETLAYDSIIETTLTTEWRYPYTSYYGQDRVCNKSLIKDGVNVTSYFQMAHNDYHSMYNALTNIGPIQISVDASEWKNYKSGIFDGCNKTHPDLNHAVQLVGVGVDEQTGEEYWLVRNSWGPMWGENGYIRLKKTGEEYTCGVDTTPRNGDACDGDNTPIKVCGTCGMLYSGIFPIIN